MAITVLQLEGIIPDSTSNRSIRADLSHTILHKTLNRWREGIQESEQVVTVCLSVVSCEVGCGDIDICLHDAHHGLLLQPCDTP